MDGIGGPTDGFTDEGPEPPDPCHVRRPHQIRTHLAAQDAVIEQIRAASAHG